MKIKKKTNFYKKIKNIMDFSKEYNLSEIYSKLSDCPIHHKQIEFLCTAPFCSKPRLSCNKCLFDQTHSSCLNKMVLLDDLLTIKCFIEKKESLKNWIIKEEHREFLMDLQEKYQSKSIDIRYQEECCVLEEKWGQIEREVLEKVKEILEKTHISLLELFKQSSNSLRLFKEFDLHFNPEKLISILQLTPLNNINQPLQNFFSMSSEQLFQLSSPEDKPNPNQKPFELNTPETHYIWLMAKIREKFSFHLKEMNHDLDQHLSFFQKKISLKNSEFINISRFETQSDGMHYGNQRSDCISFALSEEVLCHGIGVYKNLELDKNWNILVMMIDGDKTSGSVMKKQLFKVKNSNKIEEQREIEDLMFDNPIELLSGHKYTVYVLINGPNSLKGTNGMAVVKDKRLIVKFFETVYSERDPKNGTGVGSGQIPILFFSLKNGF